MEAEARFRAAATVDRYRMARLQRVHALERLFTMAGNSAGGVFAGSESQCRDARQLS
jgi:predicted ATPase